MQNFNQLKISKVSTILVFSLLLITTGVFLAGCEKKVQPENSNLNQPQVQENQAPEEMKTVGKEETEEIEKLKNDPNLVWYEVPELGIRFKVTPDTKEDLRYFIKNSDNPKDKMAYFSSQKEAERNRKLREENPETEIGWNRGWFFIKDKGLSLEEMGEDACKEPQSHSLDLADSLSFCLFRLGSKVFSDKKYEEFFHVSEIDKSKKFGIYLDEIEKIK